MAKKIRVLVADDHAIVREGVVLLLKTEPDLEVVGQAADGDAAVAEAARLTADVVVLDLGLPGLSGIECARRIRAASPATQMLALTVYDSEEYFFQALDAGVLGYVLKEAAPSDLVGAVRAVARGQAFLHPAITRKLIDDYLRQARSTGERSAYDGLTEREREVLKLIAEPCTNQQIAARLHVSVSTVQTHRENIMHKLDLHSRTELVKYAIRKGLVDVGTD